MEIQAWKFLSFWAVISLIFLKLGFNALDGSNLSDSVPTAVLFFFRHAFAVAVCHSSHYTFIYSPHFRIPHCRYNEVIFIALLLPFMWATAGLPPSFYFPLYGSTLFYQISAEDGIGHGLDFLVKLTIIGYGDNKNFVPVLVLLVSGYTAAVCNAVVEEVRLQEALPQSVRRNDREKRNGNLIGFGVWIVCSFLFATENSSILKKLMHTRRKSVEFAVGMAGTVLFQYFFKLSSFHHVLTFLYFAVAWLGNLALFGGGGGGGGSGGSGDLGVFNFLLGNVIVGCAVNQFGLKGLTWIACGASVFLFCLRHELEFVSIEGRGREEPPVIVYEKS